MNVLRSEKAFQRFLVDKTALRQAAEAVGTTETWIAFARLAWASGANWGLDQTTTSKGEDDGDRDDGS